MKATLQMWVYACDDALANKAILLGTLDQAGIGAEEFNPNASSCGIFVFQQLNEDVYIQLREISRNGALRVLALAAPTCQPDTADLWCLLEAGAADVIAWCDEQQLGARIKVRLRRWQEIEQTLMSTLVQNNLIGQSLAWRSVLRQIIEVARYTDASVLVLGESGTGKELVGRLIHTLDQRANKKDLVTVDCTTIVPELAGSEFFGHERGAFTGAAGARDGAFCLANKGTLFLDEIGDLPLPLQAQLLRVVQEHHYKRVGSNNWCKTDFRLVCATNRDLLSEIEQGQFRADLYYRIADWVCRLPPLRERPEDILPLIKHFLRALKPDRKPPELDTAVREYLLKRDYPGNVRELKQLVSQISYRHVGDGPITVGDLPAEEKPTPEMLNDWCDARLEQTIRHALLLGVGLKEISQTATETAIQIAVDEEQGNLQRAARKLGVTDRTLQLRRANKQQRSAGGAA